MVSDTCPNCGAQIPHGVEICSNCGWERQVWPPSVPGQVQPTRLSVAPPPQRSWPKRIGMFVAGIVAGFAVMALPWFGAGFLGGALLAPLILFAVTVMPSKSFALGVLATYPLAILGVLASCISASH